MNTTHELTPNALLAALTDALSKEQFDTALQLANQLCERGALPVIQLVALAGALSRLNRDPDAIAMYRHWLACHASDQAYAVQFNLATCLANSSDIAGAVEAFHGAANSAPQTPSGQAIRLQALTHIAALQRRAAPSENVLVVLYAEDIPMAVSAAAAMADCRVVAFDPLLLDKLLGSGLVNAEYIECGHAPAFQDVHEDARRAALEIEARLLPMVQHLIPQVTRLTWCHQDLYYLLMQHRSHAVIGQYMIDHMAGANVHLLINDNPASFYWPSFIPALVLMEMLNSAGIAFEAHRYGSRPDETNVAPMLLGQNTQQVDVLTHLPTCFHDAEFLGTELAAANKTLFNVHAKYWDIALAVPADAPLMGIEELLAFAPAAFTAPVEQFRSLVTEALDEILGSLLRTPAFRARQVEHYGKMYRAQFITYVLLNQYFGRRPPTRILLSNHDAGFHGPIVSFAQDHAIPILLFPHSKTTPDLQFDGSLITALTHPMQGQEILDAAQQPVRQLPLAYPEQLVATIGAPTALKRVGLLLNALCLSGIMAGPYHSYIEGIRQIAGWCAQRGLELLVRGRPGMPMMTLLARDAGIDITATTHATALPLADYARSVDLCVMFDAPTTAALEFLRNNVPIVNTVVDELARCESMTANTAVIPRAGVAATLAQLGAMADSPQRFQRFRHTQFSAYADLFANAESLRDLL
jgi:hypothetical protein